MKLLIRRDLKGLIRKKVDRIQISGPSLDRRKSRATVSAPRFREVFTDGTGEEARDGWGLGEPQRTAHHRGNKFKALTGAGETH
jgi:hypothetical protein